MTQKIIQVGNSLGITLPKAFVRQNKLLAGQTIFTHINELGTLLSVSKKKKAINSQLNSAVSPEFVKKVEDFIERNSSALKSLA